MNPEERQLIVENLKKQIRKNNWDYLCCHPEIRAFIRVVLNDAVKVKPTQIYEFTANLFRCDNIEDMSARVNDQIKRLKNLQDSAWTEYDGDMYFSDTSDSHRSTGLKHSPIESILRFSGVEKDESPEENAEYVTLPNTSLRGSEPQKET